MVSSKRNSLRNPSRIFFMKNAPGFFRDSFRNSLLSETLSKFSPKIPTRIFLGISSKFSHEYLLKIRQDLFKDSINSFSNCWLSFFLKVPSGISSLIPLDVFFCDCTRSSFWDSSYFWDSFFKVPSSETLKIPPGAISRVIYGVSLRFSQNFPKKLNQELFLRLLK